MQPHHCLTCTCAPITAPLTSRDPHETWGTFMEKVLRAQIALRYPTKTTKAGPHVVPGYIVPTERLVNLAGAVYVHVRQAEANGTWGLSDPELEHYLQGDPNMEWLTAKGKIRKLGLSAIRHARMILFECGFITDSGHARAALYTKTCTVWRTVPEAEWTGAADWFVGDPQRDPRIIEGEETRKTWEKGTYTPA